MNHYSTALVLVKETDSGGFNVQVVHDVHWAHSAEEAFGRSMARVTAEGHPLRDHRLHLRSVLKVPVIQDDNDDTKNIPLEIE